MLTGPSGAPALGIGLVAGHQPPTWPDEGGRKQFHLDLACDDIPATEDHALGLGATLADPQPGETWRVLLCRNRVRRENPTAENEHYSSDACGYHDTVSYHPMEIGCAYLKNGSFSDLDKNGKLRHWAINGGTAVKPEGKANAVVLNGRLWQTMAHGELAQKDVPRKLRYEFLAKGKGEVSVLFYRYSDTPNPKAKHGYERKFNPAAGKGGTFKLDGRLRRCTGEYTVPAGEWNSIVLSSKDSVSVYSVTVAPDVTENRGDGPQKP
jgi:hypothetical protein